LIDELLFREIDQLGELVFADTDRPGLKRGEQVRVAIQVNRLGIFALEIMGFVDYQDAMIAGKQLHKSRLALVRRSETNHNECAPGEGYGFVLLGAVCGVGVRIDHAQVLSNRPRTFVGFRA
jgi:hypothetical protein